MNREPAASYPTFWTHTPTQHRPAPVPPEEAYLAFVSRAEGDLPADADAD